MFRVVVYGRLRVSVKASKAEFLKAFFVWLKRLIIYKKLFKHGYHGTGFVSPGPLPNKDLMLNPP